MGESTVTLPVLDFQPTVPGDEHALEPPPHQLFSARTWRLAARICSICFHCGEFLNSSSSMGRGRRRFISPSKNEISMQRKQRLTSPGFCFAFPATCEDLSIWYPQCGHCCLGIAKLTASPVCEFLPGARLRRPLGSDRFCTRRSWMHPASPARPAWLHAH